jgi:hypothetical protein
MPNSGHSLGAVRQDTVSARARARDKGTPARKWWGRSFFKGKAAPRA